MQTQYIYSTSRVNTLAQYLLTMTDINRLLVAEPGDDLRAALKETYLAPYISRVHNENMAAAIEETLIEAKKLVHKIAPDGDMFRVLWVQYDIHNLRVFAKAHAIGKGFDDIITYTSARGIHDPAALFAKVQQQQLDSVYAGWQAVYDTAVRHAVAGELDQVDGVFDQLFFDTTRQIAKTADDAFLTQYVQTSIDLYNIKAALRSSTYPQIKFTPVFVTGGTVAVEALATKEQVYATLERFGGDAVWRTAVEQYQSGGNTTMLDARVDEYLLTIAKRASADMFSAASLVLYYLQVRQAAANVRTIVVGKNSSMTEADIRSNLRLAYVNN